MNQKFIFAFILLFAISVTNAITLKKRTTEFLKCNSLDPLSFISVIVSPNPPVPGQNATFSVSGVLGQDIKENGVIIIAFRTDDCVPLGVYPTTSVPPTKAGIYFGATIEATVPRNFKLHNSTVYYINAYLENGNVPIGCAEACFGQRCKN
ncbi:14149_t:CDS:1 [Dentiscutata erythropus]|uniref:14149_t:CDS:1 n=1 Tax=Dentiscutata erythropus TaxID=1348616 RepID=A0A9N9J4J7_9GLOM|nr:14149_t:CDS:1 [Dentiscutata erythropus]